MKKFLKNKFLVVGGSLVLLCACQTDKKDDQQSDKSCCSIKDPITNSGISETPSENISSIAPVEEPVSDEISVQNEIIVPEVSQTAADQEISEISISPVPDELKDEEQELNEVSSESIVSPSVQ